MVECEFCLYSTEWQLSGSFNRYMVECEFYHFKAAYERRTVLIDTWWNVNE